MKSCGVIVEYNPFHNGHKYHLEEARRITGADVIVAVMSGNFLQRGEPAIIDKWERAQAALTNGADLVVELPIAYAVQSADYFTRGGVKMLQELGVDALCFGTDIKEEVDYEAFGKFNQEHRDLIDRTYHELKNNGQSYPQQMTEVYRKLLPNWTLDFSSPNHILGMGYAKENAKYDKPMKIYPIKRMGNQYHDEKIAADSFASATAIRKETLSGRLETLNQVIPKETFDKLDSEELISWEQAWPLLRYQLITTPVEELKQIYQMVEGLEYRLKEVVLKANTFSEFVEGVKSKRYTWTRIQRLCVYVLLQIKQEEVEKVWANSFLRILGFNECGRLFLKQQKKETTIPLITNINKKNETLLSLDIKAGQVYQLLTSTNKHQDYFKSPLYIKERTQ